MPTFVYNIGVDLSKHFLDCFLLPDKSHFRLSNDSAGVSQLCDRARELLQNGAQVRLVVEASGGYERLLHEQLTAAAVPVAIVNPKRVRAYAKGIGRLAKTDRVSDTPEPTRNSNSQSAAWCPPRVLWPTRTVD